MFGLFKSTVIEDAQLGPLKRSGKTWEGSISLAGGRPVPLALDGTKQAPFPEAIAAAVALDGKMTALMAPIGPELLSHAEPYQDALRDPDYADEIRAHYEDDAAIDRILAISTPEQAQAAATIEGVEIGPEGAAMMILIKMSVPWDVEHTVGAFFEDWRFAELNASV